MSTKRNHFTKRWPKAKALVAFARAHCDITDSRAKELMDEIVSGVLLALSEAITYMNSNKSFRKVGLLMLSEWNKGFNLSLKLDDQVEIFPIPNYHI